MNQKLLFSSALLVGIAGTQQALAQKKKVQDQKRPNVVFILADDLGFGDLSCYGQEKFETPNIDKLAQEGMRFTQCYSGTTVSAPSRSCLLTGTHSGHTAIRGNVELDPEGQFPLPADAQTIFHDFQNAGYKTGAFGNAGGVQLLRLVQHGLTDFLHVAKLAVQGLRGAAQPVRDRACVERRLAAAAHHVQRRADDLFLGIFHLGRHARSIRFKCVGSIIA